jgi:hypothetical protein
MITTLSEYISYKMTPGSEKDNRASSIIVLFLSATWTTSTGNARGRVQPTFLPLATHQVIWIWLLLTKWGKDDMRAIHQGRLDSGLTCRKRWLHPMPKAPMANYNANNSSPRSVTSNLPQSPLQQSNLKNNWPTPNIPTRPIKVFLIVWGSMRLITVSVAIMVVLHSVEVIHIPYESQLSLVAI